MDYFLLVCMKIWIDEREKLNDPLNLCEDPLKMATILIELHPYISHFIISYIMHIKEKKRDN